MDAAGVRTQVLSFSTPNIWHPDPTVRAGLVRAFNDACAEVVAAYPGRFALFGNVPLPHVDAAIAEAARALDELGAVGTCTHFGDRPVHAPEFEPFRQVHRRELLARGHAALARLFNTCTHRGARVCRQDQGNAKTFQCFYHAWTFDNCGQLIGVPGDDAYGSGWDRTERALRAAPRTESYRGFYFTKFSADGEDLATYLDGAKEYIDLVVDQAETGMHIIPGENKYSIRANWKLLSENSFDAYHVLSLHQTYYAFLASLGIDVTGARGWTAAEAHAYDLGHGHAVTDTPARMPRPVALWHPCFGEQARGEIDRLRARLVARHGEERAYRMAETVRNMFIYPNLFLIDGPAVMLRVYWPTAPDGMEVHAWALGPADEEPALLANRLVAYQLFLGPGGFGTPDDVEVLEACQEGFAARAVEWSDVSRGMQRQGPRLFTDELHLRAFWREWHAHIQGQPHGDHDEGRKQPRQPASTRM